jgi:hypothetical protein
MKRRGVGEGRRGWKEKEGAIKVEGGTNSTKNTVTVESRHGHR